MPPSMDVCNALCIVLLSALFYVLSGCIYRLYFHRISHIPGPKLGALTYFYQGYYDIFPYRGQWIFQQIRLHQRYGPVVRVGPDEVHIDDPEFYTEFSGNGSSKKRDKSKLYYWFVGADDLIDSSSFATLDAEHHQMRRRALGGFFDVDMVRKLEDRIRVHVERMTERLLMDAKDDRAVDLIPLSSALTLDVISEYSFGRSTNALDTPELGKPVRKNIENGMKIHPFARLFPRLTIALMKLVDVAAPHFSAAKELKSFESMVYGLTTPVYESVVREDEKGEGASGPRRASIVESLAHSTVLPPEEKTLPRIAAELAGVVGGGAETLGRTLAVGIYHVLANPDIHSRILDELRSLMPTSKAPLPSVTQLERLPYLTATIHEATRIAHGVTGRLVRISPDKDIIYMPSESTLVRDTVPAAEKPVVIPRGATFSMSHYIQHTDPVKFPNPALFSPDRYLGEQGKETLRYLVPFGEGPRSCLGINIAWSEMYLCFAALLGNMKLELSETTQRDVTISREVFVGILDPNSKGIRVKVKGV